MNTNDINLPLELEKIFSTVPPSQIKKSFSEIFTRCLLAMENDIEYEQLNKLVNDFYLIYKFLEKVEKSGMYSK